MIRKMFGRVGQLSDVIQLTLGEPSIPTPDFVVSAATSSLAREETHYVDNAGIPELRTAIAERYSSQTALALSGDNVMITFGASEALLLGLAAVVDPGDHVVVPDPGYPNYLGLLHLLSAQPSTVSALPTAEYRLAAADVIASCDERTKAIILNSPANPTGAMMRDDEFARVVEFAARRDITVISDEVYAAITYGKDEYRSALEHGAFGHTVVVGSFSKSYAMTGWRVGFAVSSPHLIRLMAKLQEAVAACVPPFVQHGALAALHSGDDFVKSMRNSYRQAHDLVVSEVSAMRKIRWRGTDGSFYAFIDIRDSNLCSEEFCTRLLTEQRLALVPGVAFGPGGEGFVRLSFAASSETLTEALTRLRRFTSTL